MAYVHPASVEHERKRWMRPDAHLWIRQDAHRFMAPGAPRYVGKDMVRYFWPEHQTQAAHARGVEGARSDDSEHAAKLAAWRADLPRLRRELADIQAELKFQRFLRWLRAGGYKAGFNPGQPRVPAGNPDGGQWTSEGGAGAGSGRNDPRILSDTTPGNDWKPGAQYVQSRARGGPVLINGRMVTPTPGQAARLTVAEAQARGAIARVREIDPNWRPSPSAYESVEGLIRAHEADARQAEQRFVDLQRHGIGPGPFANESISARGPERDFTPEERREINRIGNEAGCHTCGIRDPGTTSGNFVPDHQPPNALNPNNKSQRLYPHCIYCSDNQGLWILRDRRRVR